MVQMWVELKELIVNVNALALIVSVGLGAVLIAGMFARSIEKPMVPKRRLPEGKTEFTIAEIAVFDGKSADEEEPILTIIDGLVYDLKKGKDFYGKGGPYHSFVGRDATRLLAKNKTSDKDDTGEPLTEAEVEQLDKWKEFFNNKYGSIGRLVK